MSSGATRRARGPLIAAAAAVALATAGCAGTYGYGGRDASLPEHVIFDLSHPWHSYPAQAVGLPGAVLLCTATLPLSLAEGALTGTSPASRTDPGVVFRGSGIVGLAPGFVVGLAFYVLGAPLEATPDDATPAATPDPAGAP